MKQHLIKFISALSLSFEKNKVPITALYIFVPFIFILIFGLIWIYPYPGYLIGSVVFFILIYWLIAAILTLRSNRANLQNIYDDLQYLKERGF